MQSFTKQCLFFTEKAEFVVARFSRLTALYNLPFLTIKAANTKGE